MAELLHADSTGQIIGVYYTVYNRLSQTYPEYIFEKAMVLLLRQLWIECIRQDEYEIHYKDKLVGLQRLDIFVAGAIVVELKVAEHIDPIHLAQLLSYLKVVRAEVGLLLRFGGPKPEFARRVLTPRSWQQAVAAPSIEGRNRAELLFPDLTAEILGGAIEVFKTLGPGFIHRIYANACYHELRLRGMDVMPRNDFHVFLDTADLGAIKLAHL
jgi:GxxExxY protein